jgi:hypothetical protein
MARYYLMFNVLFQPFGKENMFGIFEFWWTIEVCLFFFNSLLVWKWKDLYNVGSSKCYVWGALAAKSQRNCTPDLPNVVFWAWKSMFYFPLKFLMLGNSSYVCFLSFDCFLNNYVRSSACLRGNSSTISVDVVFLR